MAKAISLYVDVAACGKKADGSKAKPFASLVDARDALRKLRRSGKLNAPAKVLISPGLYRLAEPLVFTPEDGGGKYPVTWTGVGGRPVISGGRAIVGWRGGEINGLKCWQADIPEVKAGKWWFTQLFLNGRRRLRARLPKMGFYRFAGVPEAEAKLDPGGFFHGAMSAFYAPGEFKNFHNLSDIDVVVPDHWYENHLRVSSVDEASHTIHFSTKGYSRFSRDETGKHTRFRVDNAMEACTDPGDWYLDRTTGVISYIPMAGEELDKVVMEAPVLDSLLIVKGDAIDPQKRVSNLRFEFLDFRHAEWELPRNNAGALQSAYQVPAAVRFIGAEDCLFYACRVSQVAGWGVEVLRGCERNRIVACAVHDLGGGGVKVGHEGGLNRGWVDGNHGAFAGMDHESLGWGPCREDKGGALRGRDKAPSSRTIVSDCSIHDGGKIFHSAIGIWVGDASGNRLLHNHIYKFNYSGISCGWTWGFAPAYTCDNRIEGNRIHGIGHGMLSDMGAIYTLGRHAGSTIKRNYIHDVQSYGYGGWGIYPDEGSSWFAIEENVVCNTKCGGFHQHYGRDNIVRHNIFADAIENQVQVSRKDMVRMTVFENNLVQGSGKGLFWNYQGWQRSKVDGNVYAADTGRATLMAAGTDWQNWQQAGKDQHGRFIDSMLLDANGGEAATGNAEALKAAGIDPAMVAEVVANAGPRFRDKLPIDGSKLPVEKEKPCPIIEALFWPWASEWPVAGDANHPWSGLPASASVVDGVPQAISLTVENRGAAAAQGSYKLRVIPAKAAKFDGPDKVKVSLKPGGKLAFDTTVVATGKERSFQIVAEAEGKGFGDSCLYFNSVCNLILPKLGCKPQLADMEKAMPAVPEHDVSGNPDAIEATCRLALASGHLLLQVDAADPKPTRGGELWAGSSVEIYGAVSNSAATRKQLVFAPAVGKSGAAACVAENGKALPAEGVEVASSATSTGWKLWAIVPLSLLGIDAAADSFAFDLVVNVVGTDGTVAGRAYLASDIHPYGSPANYLYISAVDRK